MIGKLTLTVERPNDKGGSAFVDAYRDGMGRWVCLDAEWLRILNMFEVPDGYWPDREMTLVELVARTYHGRIQDNRPVPTVPHREDVAY